jgi:hypothetical protein
MTDDHALVAEKLRQLLIDSSPLIEEYTAAVCPDCTDVCCRQKHGLYRERDISYLDGLGMTVPTRDGARPLEGPCEAMGPTGCVHPRWLRPFKCTWYFCEPLLAALDEGPQKKARRLSAVMQEMIDRYGALSGNEAPWKNGEGACGPKK